MVIWSYGNGIAVKCLIQIKWEEGGWVNQIDVLRMAYITLYVLRLYAIIKVLQIYKLSTIKKVTARTMAAGENSQNFFCPSFS